ncbi:glycosyltransferase family 4 protein [Granulosicoccus sp.]|nr:glycosyltransferase family 4 protein [Granulosicoccus sp.]
MSSDRYCSNQVRQLKDSSNLREEGAQVDNGTRVLPALPEKNGRSLRVLFAVDSRFPGFGGAESQALKLAHALREQGVQVDFVVPHLNPAQPLNDNHQGFKITRIEYPRIRLLGSLIVMYRFRRYLLQNADSFDAVHVHITHLMAAAAGFSRARSGLPVITKISGFYEFEGGVLDQSVKFKPLNYLIRLGLKKVDFVQTISVQTREKLLQAGFSDDQIQFIPNGIDTREPPSPIPSDELIRIGYCGRLREIKGVHVLIDGYAQLAAQHPGRAMQLIIAGDGETMPELKKQAQALGVDSQIEWLGRIDDTSAFFRSIHLYVQPSFAEGLPNSVMEAMVEQRAVIASDIGGNNDLIDGQHNGLLFPAGDAAALAHQLGSLIDDPAHACKLAAQGRQLIVDRYGFESVTDRLAALYSHG